MEIYAGIGANSVGIWKNKRFTSLFVSQFISAIGNNLYTIALPWYVLLLTNSKFSLTIVGFAQTIPAIIGLFIGVFIDRWNKRRTMIVTDAIRSILAILLFLLTWVSTPDRWLKLVFIAVLVLLSETMGAMFSPAQFALIPQIVEEKELGPAVGINQSGSALAGLIGSAGGGAALGFLGAPILFLSNALSFIASIIGVVIVKTNEQKPDVVERTSFVAEWKDGMRTILQYPILVRLSVFNMIGNFAVVPLDIVNIAWVKGPLHGTAFMLGVIMATFLIGITAGGLLPNIARKIMSSRHIAVFGSVLIGIAVMSVPIWTNMYWISLLMLVIGVVIGITNSVNGELLIRTIPESTRGRIGAALNAGDAMAQPLGMLVFGLCISFLPIFCAYLAIGACLLVNGLIMIPVDI